tara:strand:- start:121 stop:1089 length:969 start_codon:yes stop_codon:yes gene_type:complete
MVRRNYLVGAITILLFCQFIPIMQSQQLTPGVELECDSSTIDIEVYPSADPTGVVDCTVTNPSIHFEDIVLQYQGGPLSIAGPSSISLAGGESEEFQVAVRGENYMQRGSFQIQIDATVTQVNGIPNPNYDSTSVNLIVEILQFPGLQLACLDSVLEIQVGEEGNYGFSVMNMGNFIDEFTLSIENEEALNNLGWTVNQDTNSVLIDSYYPEIVRIGLFAPNSISYGADYSSGDEAFETQSLTSNGTIENIYKISLKATSDYSKNWDGYLVSETISCTIKVIQYPEDSTFSSIGDILPSTSSFMAILVILLSATYSNSKRRL